MTARGPTSTRTGRTGAAHFTGIDDLLREAFTLFADHIVMVFEHHLNRATNADQAREAVTDLVHALSEGPQRDLILTQELYTLAARRPEYRELTQAWMSRSRHLLERHFDPGTARQLDALIEGLTLHRALDTAPHDRQLTIEAVRRISGTA
ncbi:TetR/AcrR family transcriptional regulator [Streptomyces sp. NPDC057565]|uniref:TetR/AcrR family transcriptional regulator n=1 Tax=Streptomyces sp. NPDC057565 TaxID=3346169 RepID=UPI0036A6E55A